MKRKMFRKIMAASLATAMTFSLAACDSKPADPAQSSASGSTEVAPSGDGNGDSNPGDGGEVGIAPILKDANGNVYDLGGMEIIIRDWWSPEEPAAPANDYEEARQEYRDWIQETYNFKIRELAISDWTNAPADFVNYVTTGGDDNNYMFVLRADPAITSAMSSDLMYDLSKLDCLDFSRDKFNLNLVHKLYSKGGAIYGMNAGVSEARGGVFFNKRILEEVGIKDSDLYELQRNHEWTWDKWKEIMTLVQRDIDGDGIIDVYGTTQNDGAFVMYCVYSNGGEYVGMENGKYTYRLEDPETVEGLDFAVDVLTNYKVPNENWDDYKNFFTTGKAAFMPEDAYVGTDNGFIKDMEDDFGFICFPMGPKMSDYTNCWQNNICAIPSCYDDEKAWKIAFAWNLYTEDVPGYEDYKGWKAAYYRVMRDLESVDETLEMMTTNGMITYDGLIPNLAQGPDFTWNINAGAVVSEKIDAIRDVWKKYIDDANN